MTNIKHHPDDSTLMSYAAGSLPEALSAVVAAHLELCPHCAKELRAMELIGAAIFENLEPSAISPDSRAAFCDSKNLGKSQSSRRSDTPARGGVLATIIGGDLSDVRWKRLGLGIWHFPIPLSPGCEGDLRLLKVAAGQVMPAHGHGGTELSLLLQGAYSDELGAYRTGDLSDLGDDVEHSPVSDPDEGCICLIASDRRARFKDFLPRLLQPLTGF